MKIPPVLTTAPFEYAAMDYVFLRQEGISHLEKMAADLWTDFNAHDPGITILEQLCYAITDLANRASFDMPDLLAKAGEETYRSLYTPAQIMTSNPVSPNDIRKLVIDVDGVKNAWVEQVVTQEPALHYDANQNRLIVEGDPQLFEAIHLKGLYRVLIEATSYDRQTEIAEKVKACLYAHRGLCEDFEEITVLVPEEVQVEASVEIAAVDDAGDVLLQIYQRLAEHISPSIQFYTLDQMLQAGHSVDQIFDGPRLEHGFVRTDDLEQSQRRTMLYTSDLISEIVAVPGVRAVRNIGMAAGGQPEDWVLHLNESKAPRLDLVDSKITLSRNNLPLSVNIARVLERFRLSQLAEWERPDNDELDLILPEGRDRNVANYHSIQHQFPAAYGIGAIGLPDTASTERKAQAKQLKAYLLFFDQLLANYFAQLAHARDLFSFSSASATTYFANVIDDLTLHLEGIRKPDTDADTHEDRLRQMTEQTAVGGTLANAAPGSNRRNRFLNHLLARFAEQFTDYSLILYGAYTQGANSSEDKLLSDKEAFLQDYAASSRRRGSGCDYSRTADRNNRSGLEQRLIRKLGITGEERFFLVEHILLRPVAEDTTQLFPILVDPKLKDPYSLQLSLVLPSWPGRFQNQDFRTFAEVTIREETPAHIFAHIHWLDQSAMQVFENAYYDWLEKLRIYNSVGA